MLWKLTIRSKNLDIHFHVLDPAIWSDHSLLEMLIWLDRKERKYETISEELNQV